MTETELTVAIEHLEAEIQAAKYADAQRSAELILAYTELAEHIDLQCRVLLAHSDSCWRRSMFDLALQSAERALLLDAPQLSASLRAKAHGNIGIVLTSLCQYDQALISLRTALALYEQEGDKKAAAQVIGNLGAVYGNQSDYHKALECFERANEICRKLGDRRGMAQHTRNMGLVYSLLSDHRAALEYSRSALHLFTELNDRSGSAACAVTIGNVYEELSDFPSAIEQYQLALELYQEAANTFGVASCYGSIGNVYLSVADYARALENMTKARALFEEIGSADNLAACTGNIGLVYQSLGEYQQALEYLQKALSLSDELGIKSGVATRIGNIGSVYRDLRDFPRALEYCHKARLLHLELGNKMGLAVATSSIASIYQELGEYDLALQHFREALREHEEISNTSGMAGDIAAMGIIYAQSEFEGHDDALAEQYLVRAKQMNDDLGTKGQNIPVLEAIAALYKKQQRWEAIDMLEHFHTLQRSVYNEDVKKFAERLEFERITAEREKRAEVERTRFQERESILNNILPEEITTRLIKGENPIADHFECVSVLFMDIVGFTPLSGSVSAQQLVALLNSIFTQADLIMRVHGLEKIKTIGDAYMAVAGVPVAQDDHATRAAFAALDLLDVITRVRTTPSLNSGDRDLNPSIAGLQVRIGLHCGPAAAGVVGETKFLYDLWGDAVNTASRMESHGLPGRVHCSADFATQIRHNTDSVRLIERGEIEVKGKGTMRTYFLEKS